MVDDQLAGLCMLFFMVVLELHVVLHGVVGGACLVPCTVVPPTIENPR